MLFEEVDKKKTKRKVDQLLSNYHRIRRVAGLPVEQKITASFSLEPFAPSNTPSNPIERGVIKKLEAEEILQDIHRAINCLTFTSRQRIYFKYISYDCAFDYEIYMNLNISKDTYYRELEKAQIEFAEAFQGGKLIEYMES